MESVKLAGLLEAVGEVCARGGVLRVVGGSGETDFLYSTDGNAALSRAVADAARSMKLRAREVHVRIDEEGPPMGRYGDVDAYYLDLYSAALNKLKAGKITEVQSMLNSGLISMDELSYCGQGEAAIKKLRR